MCLQPCRYQQEQRAIYFEKDFFLLPHRSAYHIGIRSRSSSKFDRINDLLEDNYIKLSLRNIDVSINNYYMTMSKGLFPIYVNSIWHGGLCLHTAFIEHAGKGYAIVGQGNAGKTTCARRIPDHWQAIADDEVLIVKDLSDEYLVHPFPTWSDYIWNRECKKTWDSSSYSRLTAFFFINKHPVDAITPISKTEACLKIYKSANEALRRFYPIFTPSERLLIQNKLMDNASTILKKIRAFNINVSLNGKFWEKIQELQLV